MSARARKTGGLQTNPLLQRTEPARDEGAEEVEELTFEEKAADSTQAQEGTQTRTRVDTSPSRFTFYFTPDQLERLDQVWERMRKQRGKRERLSKSKFVRLALNRLLDDFDQNPAEVINQLRQQS